MTTAAQRRAGKKRDSVFRDGACFVLAGFATDIIELRIAHRTLHPGMAETIDEVCDKLAQQAQRYAERKWGERGSANT